mmetsp:Transcript_26413/g.28409  ORF Transcript_26413/g.28409 Transcript_26413/m.28409 type:complete len:423 (-) Transcript_26413:143-1411(-)
MIGSYVPLISLSLTLKMCWLLLLDCDNSVVGVATFPSPQSLHKISIVLTTISISTSSTVSCCLSSSAPLFLVSKFFRDLRGGESDYDESNEEFYSEYDSECDDDSKREYDHSLIDPPTSRPQPGYNSNSRRRGKGTTTSSASSSSSSSSWSGASSTATNAVTAATKLATKSLSITGSLAWNALVKQPGKLAYHVIRPKYVDLIETYGLWRLDQQVVENNKRPGGDHRTISSVATIEFVRPKRQHRQLQQESRRRDSSRFPLSSSPPLVVVRRSKDDTGNDTGNDKDSNTIVYRAPYTFVRKNKLLKGASLSSFQTSFVAPAFLIGENQTRLYGYKGTWQRKLADKSVIKLVGKIYQVHKQKFGKKRGEYVFGSAVGTFVMRRRITFTETESESEYEEHDENDDEYDDIQCDDYDDVDHDYDD